jgi:hypothetical protein
MIAGQHFPISHPLARLSVLITSILLTSYAFNACVFIITTRSHVLLMPLFFIDDFLQLTLSATHSLNGLLKEMAYFEYRCSYVIVSQL